MVWKFVSSQNSSWDLFTNVAFLRGGQPPEWDWCHEERITILSLPCDDAEEDTAYEPGIRSSV